jgi:outer membrane cobalamin receptor
LRSPRESDGLVDAGTRVDFVLKDCCAMKDKTKNMIRNLALILALVAPIGLAAQTPQVPAPEPARFATEIVVTPERGETPRGVVPASTIVIDSALLPALPVVHPSEVLSYLPGFHVARAQFYAGRPVISARGFFGGGEAEYTLLLVDGVSMADVESGLIDWSAIATSSIQRIEASRGPGAALYGDSAVGGVIQILTDRRSGGQLTATGGAFDTFTADGAYRRRSPAYGFSVSGATRTTNGGFEHSGGREAVGATSVDGMRGGLSWRWSAAGNDRHRDDPGVLSRDQSAGAPYASDPLYRFDNTSRRDASTAVTLGHSTAVWRPQLRAYAAVRDEDLIRTILLAPGLGDLRARGLSSVASGGSLEGEYTLARRRGSPVVRYGVDLSREQLDTNYRSVSAAGAIGALNSEVTGRRVRAGMFASTSWAPRSRVRVSGVVRWDNADDAGFGALSPGASAQAQRAWSPRGGVVVQLNDAGSATLFVQASRAFKVPTLDQLFDPRPYPDFRGGTFTISNPRLVPQRAANVEAGVSGGEKARWSALAYYMSVDDEIDFDFSTFSYANIGQSRHTGLELEAEGRWWSRVRPSASYAFSRVTKTDDDTQLKNVPRHHITAGAHVDFPGAIGVHAQYHRAWGAFLDDANALPLAGPSTLDMRVRRPLGRHAIFLDVLNLTGHVYEEYGFALADFRGRLVPYASSGAPRAVRTGLTLSW